MSKQEKLDNGRTISFVVLQLQHDLTTSRPHDLTTSRPHDLTTSRPHDLTTSRPHDLTTSRPHAPSPPHAVSPTPYLPSTPLRADCSHVPTAFAPTRPNGAWDALAPCG